MEQYPVKGERKRFSKPVLDAVLLLIGKASEYLHNQDGLLVEIKLISEEEQVERAYAVIEQIISERQFGANTHLLIKHQSFRVQISNTYDSKGLVSRYIAYTYWEDETGEEIEDDECDDSDDESYETVMAKEEFRQMAEEHDALFGPDQEDELLSILSSLR